MEILVKFFLNYQEEAGIDEKIIKIPGDKAKLEQVYSCLERSTDFNPEKVQREGIVLLNERVVNNRKPKKVEVKDGDNISFMPMVSGG